MATGPLPRSPAESSQDSSAQVPFALLDDDAVEILIGITSMLLALCTVAVGGRLLARRVSRVQLEADDYLVIIALVSLFPLAWSASC